MHFRMTLLRIFRKIQFNRHFRLVSTLVLGVALLFSATPISVYATSIVPIGADIISNATEIGVGEYILNLLRTGLELDFTSYSNDWTHFLNEWSDEGLIKASIDQWIDKLQNREYSEVINKVPVKHIGGLDRDNLRATLETKPIEHAPQQPIELTAFEKECLKGAYNIFNQNIYNVQVYDDPNWAAQCIALYNSLSRASFATAWPSLKHVVDLSGYSDVKYLINPYDNYNVTLYVNGVNYNSQYLYANLPYAGSSWGLRLMSTTTDGFLHVNSMAMMNTPGNSGYFISSDLSHSFTSLSQSLLYLWGSKDIPIFYGCSLDDCELLNNPIFDDWTYSGNFHISENNLTPVTANYPNDSYIDMGAFISAIQSAITNKTKLDLSDIDDLIVDVNGVKAVSTYEVYRNDYDVLAQEIFGSNNLVVSPDPAYMEAYGYGLETAGNIINSSVSVIPEDISLFLFGGAFVLLIILVLRRGSE